MSIQRCHYIRRGPLIYRVSDVLGLDKGEGCVAICQISRCVCLGDSCGKRAKEMRTRSLKLLKRLTYGLAVASLVSVLGVMVYQCLAFFFVDPTYFESRSVSQSEAAFPSLTVCRVANGYKTAVLKVRTYARR